MAGINFKNFGKSKEVVTATPAVIAETPKIEVPKQTETVELPKPGVKFNFGTKPNAGFAALKETVKPAPTILRKETEVKHKENVNTTIAQFDKPAIDPLVHPSQPESLEAAAVIEFKNNIALIEASFEQPALLKQAVVNTMLHLKEHSFLEKTLMVNDMAIMVRALRGMYGVVIENKTAVRTKKMKTTVDADEFTKAMEGGLF